MIRSRAELAAHLMKAARGAGLPLALAEDLYTAAPFMTEADISWIAKDLRAGGTELSDMVLRLDAAQTGAAITGSGALEAFAAARGWGMTQGFLSDTAPVPSGPLEVADALWAQLEAFAARTNVPESDASRARGAGAGDIDND